MSSILFQNARIWDGERLFPADLLTEGGHIAKIEPHISASADITIDATDKIASAGLVDAHVHLKGISSVKYATDASLATLPFGVTAAVDASGVWGEKTLLEYFLPEVRVLVCPDIKDGAVDFAPAMAGLARYGDSVAGVKLFLDTHMGVRDLLPLQQTVTFAAERNLRTVVHAKGAPVPMAALLDCLRTGDVLTHAYHGAPFTAAEDDFQSLKRAQKRGVIIDVGMAGHINTDFGVLRDGIAAGIPPQIISSDITGRSAYTRGGCYGLTMCMSICEALGMRESEILKAVTTVPADAFGLAAGRLAVGGRADIALLGRGAQFDLTDGAGNRVYGANGYVNYLTVKDGQIVFRR